MIKTLGLFVALMLTGLSSYAQKKVAVYETVVEDVVFSTSSRVVIDEKTIKNSHAPNVTTLLAAQSNVTITNTPFQPNSIYIRGGDASHVLILIDGVPFYDASTIQRTLDLNSIDIKSIRRIEIIKGSQTVLYGGQALSGVIKIDTIPKDIGTKTLVDGRLGTHEARDLSVVHSNMNSDTSGTVFRGHGAWRNSASPVIDSSKTYERNNWNAEGTYFFKGFTEGHLKANYIQDFNQSPSSNNNYQIIDADNFDIFSRQLGLSSHLKLKDVVWSPRMSLSAQNSLRTFKQPLSATNSQLVDYHYGANLRTLRLDTTPYQSSDLTVIAGVSYIHEDFLYRNQGTESSNAFSEQKGIFTKADFTINPFVNLSAGVRAEMWDNKNPVGTYQVGLTLFENIKLEASTGYKIPSLFQMFSNYGNPDLKEERATQYNLTKDFDISENQQASVTLFQSKYSNLIVTQGAAPSLRYANVNSSETSGAEFFYTYRPSTSSTLVFTYGYQEPRDLDNNRWLQRRPLVNGSIKYSQTWDRHNGGLELMGAGEKIDRISNTSFTSIPGYMIANASYSFKLKDDFKIYTRINNLWNHRYQETYSYYTEGISGYIGAEFWL